MLVAMVDLAVAVVLVVVMVSASGCVDGGNGYVGEVVGWIFLKMVAVAKVVVVQEMVALYDDLFCWIGGGFGEI